MSTLEGIVTAVVVVVSFAGIAGIAGIAVVALVRGVARWIDVDPRYDDPANR